MGQLQRICLLQRPVHRLVIAFAVTAREWQIREAAVQHHAPRFDVGNAAALCHIRRPARHLHGRKF